MMAEQLGPASGFRHRFSKFRRDLGTPFRSKSPNTAASRSVNTSHVVPPSQTVDDDQTAVPATGTVADGESATPLWTFAMKSLQGASDPEDKDFGLSEENYESAISYLNRESHGPLLHPEPSHAAIERLRAYAPVIASVKGAAMAAAQFDPHKIAPYVVAGIFFLVEFSINTIPADERIAIEEIFVAIDSIILRWQRFELYKMPRWTSKSDVGILASLSVLKQKIPEIYGSALQLQTKIRKACRSDKSRIVTVLLKRRVLWESDLKNLKVLNEVCERELAKIGDEIDFSNKNAEILSYIKQSDDPEPAHLSLRERLRLDQAANIETGQWFVAGHLQHLCALQSQDTAREGAITSVSHEPTLWLKGTVGTGKTTLMCQAITYLLNQQALRGAASFRMAHYYCDAKANNAGDSGPDSKGVLRGLCARLARLPEWDNRTRGRIDSSVRRFYETICSDGKRKSGEVTWKQWQDLFTSLVDATDGDVIIAIDALDECTDVNTLLDFLGRVQRVRPALKLLFSSREHVSVAIYFEHRLTQVQCSSQNTSNDLKDFISGRLATLAEETGTKESIYFNEKFRGLQQQVHDALLIGANGMFEWVDIWFAIVFPAEPRYQTMNEEEAWEEISLIKTSSSPSSHSAFDQLMATYDLLWEANTAVKGASGSLTVLFRVVLSALQPLTLQQLHEARLIHANKKLPTDVDPSYKSTQYMCTNFLTENSSGALVWSHASAKEYVQQRKDSSGQLDFADEKSHRLMFDLCCRLMEDYEHEAWKRAGFDLAQCSRLLYEGNASNKILAEFETVCGQYDLVKKTIKDIDDQELRDIFLRFLATKSSVGIISPLLGPKSFASYVAHTFPEHMSRMANRSQGPSEVRRTIVKVLCTQSSAVRSILFSLAAARAILNQTPPTILARASEHMRIIKERKHTSKYMPGTLFTLQLNLIDSFEARFWAISDLGTFVAWKDAISALPQRLQVDVAGVSDLWPLLGQRKQRSNRDEDGLRSSLAHELAQSGSAQRLRFILEFELECRGEIRSLQFGDDRLCLPIHHVVGRKAYNDEALQVIMQYDPHKSEIWNCGAKCREMDRIYTYSPISMLFVKDNDVGLPIHEAAKAGNARAVEMLLQRELDMAGIRGEKIQHVCDQQDCAPRSLQLFERNRLNNLALHQVVLQGFITEAHSDCIFKMLEYEQKWRTLKEPPPPPPPTDQHQPHQQQHQQQMSSELLASRSADGFTLGEICEYRLSPASSARLSPDEVVLLERVLRRLRAEFKADKQQQQQQQQQHGIIEYDKEEEKENEEEEEKDDGAAVAKDSTTSKTTRELGRKLRDARFYAERDRRINKKPPGRAAP